MKKANFLTLCLCLCLFPISAVFAQGNSCDDHVLVGRITTLEGQLLRYVYAEKDWVATVKDAPFGLDDALYSSEAGKAEFKLPNATWARIGADTQVQLIALKEDVTEIDVAAGMARLYNKSRIAVVTATTPFGFVVAQPGTAFDLYVGDNSAEIISLNGTVDFILQGDKSKYPLEAGGASIISDGRRAIEGDGNVDADWDEWNLTREQFWTQRVQVRGESIQYLPPALHEDAYDLDNSGKWERVHYEGEYRHLWRPARVAADWQPFTAGRWTVYHEDNCWIPEEEYGYVTHHYGNWVYVGSPGAWYWAPPVTVRIGRVSNCACWYPGRVAWIHSGPNIGWVVLGASEPYYSHHYWGPGAVLIGAGPVSINIGNLAYAHYPVIVEQSVFYGVNSYVGVRVGGIAPALVLSSYAAAPVVSAAIFPGYERTRGRFIYDTRLADVRIKPHAHALTRIEHNRTLFRRAERISASDIRRRTARISTGVPLRGPAARTVERPRLTGKMVPADKVRTPRGELGLRERPLKGGSVRHPSAAGGARTGIVPGGRPDEARRIEPARPGGPGAPEVKRGGRRGMPAGSVSGGEREGGRRDRGAQGQVRTGAAPASRGAERRLQRQEQRRQQRSMREQQQRRRSVERSRGRERQRQQRLERGPGARGSGIGRQAPDRRTQRQGLQGRSRQQMRQQQPGRQRPQVRQRMQMREHRMNQQQFRQQGHSGPRSSGGGGGGAKGGRDRAR